MQIDLHELQRVITSAQRRGKDEVTLTGLGTAITIRFQPTPKPSLAEQMRRHFQRPRQTLA